MRRFAILLLVLLAAVVAWLWPKAAAAPPVDAALRPEANAVPAVPMQGALAAPPSANIANVRTAALVDTPGAMPAEAPAPMPTSAATTDPTLRIRLQGIDPQAPWTAAVHVHLSGHDRNHHADTKVPDAAGSASFELPAWASEHLVFCRIGASDPNYRVLHHVSYGSLAFDQELVLDVRIAAMLTGRVLDPTGRPVAPAEVSAFHSHNNAPHGEPIIKTGTFEDGTYRLQVPTGEPLWIVAVAMQAATPRSTADDGVVNNGKAALDLLPASLSATLPIQREATLPALVLTRSARITGRVTFDDGTRAGVILRATPRAQGELPVRNGVILHRWSNGARTPADLVGVDSTGHFALSASLGATFDIVAVALGETALLGKPSMVATAPEHVEMVLPRPIRLRVLHDGAPVPGAHFDIEGEGRRFVDKTGTLTAVFPERRQVRATKGLLRSRARTLGPGDAGTTIDFELATARTKVTCEFDGEFRVGNALIDWRAADGRTGKEHLLRTDLGAPFEFHLEPGRYSLQIRAGGGEHNGRFLLPEERTIEVGSEPVALRLQAQFGGSFSVSATDSRGLYVAGVCHVFDSGGRDLTDHFLDGGARAGGPGELFARASNSFGAILPVGNYTLELDFPGHGARQQLLQIRARETTDVSIRLP